MLAVQAQRGPTGGQHGQAGAPSEQVRHPRRRVEQVFEVVEDQQQMAVAQGVLQALVDRRPATSLAHPQGVGDRERDEGRVADGGDRHERGAVGELPAQLGGDLKSEPGLAHPAGSRQCHQPGVGPAEHCGDRRHLALAADQRGERHRQRTWASGCVSGGPAPGHGGRQGGAVVRGQPQRFGQGADRRRVGVAVPAPLQLSNRVGRDSGALRQVLLGQSGRLAGGPQPRPERRLRRVPRWSVHRSSSWSLCWSGRAS